MFVFGSLDLANFELSPDGNADVVFANFIPINLGAFYSVSSQLDLGITFADDLEHAGDFYEFSIGGRYYIKRARMQAFEAGP